MFHEVVGSGTDGGGSKANHGPVGSGFGFGCGGLFLFGLFLFGDGGFFFLLGHGCGLRHSGLSLSDLGGNVLRGLDSFVGKLACADAGFFLVVILEYFPSGGAHETLWCFFLGSSEPSHLRSRDELEIILFLGVEPVHFRGTFSKGSHSEGVDLDSAEESLGVHKELFTVVYVVEVGALLGGVTNTSGVSSGNEVSDTASNSGGGVPQNFSGTTIEHGGRPDSQDNVLAVDGTVVNEGLVLLHAGSERDIVILAPSSERVEE